MDGELTAFGLYLKAKGLDRKTVAVALDISQSYVSMLARGQAKPGFKLALKFSAWTKEKYGEPFRCEQWA